MVWFYVDDVLPFHERVLRAGNAAMGLWVRAGAWSSGQLTDGFVPAEVARTLGSVGEIRRLVDVGLWEPADGGYQFHAWAEDGTGQKRQPTKAEVEEKRRKERERKAAYRARDTHPPAPQHPAGVPESVPTGHPADVPSESRGASEHPYPSLPNLIRDTSPTDVGESVPPRKTRRTATRIPEPFIVTATMREWAATEVPGLDVDASTRTFVDHWRAAAGTRATKLDWVATWRNWLRRDNENRRPGNSARESSLERRDRQRQQMFADLAKLDTNPIGAIGA